MEKSKKRFSMRNKLMIVFGALIFAFGFTLAFFGQRTARRAVMEKIETHLIDKAIDTAQIIDGRINAMFQLLEGLSRMPFLLDTELSYSEKIARLAKELQFHSYLRTFYIVDTKGTVYFLDGTTASYGEEQGFKEGIKGKKYYGEPYIDERTGNSFVADISVPIYDNNKRIIGILLADMDGTWLSNQIDDIVVGKTGYCYVLDLKGTVIAHNNIDRVKEKENIAEMEKTDKTLASLAAFEKMAVNS